MMRAAMWRSMAHRPERRPSRHAYAPATKALMPDFLSAYAASQPDKPAVIDDRPDGTVTTLTFAELNDRTNRLANLLLALGAKPGETTVVWCGQNSPGLLLMMGGGR